MLFFSTYLCKIFFWNASSPFYTELLRPTWIGDVCTLNQHSLHKNAILRCRQNAFDWFLIVVSLKNTKNRTSAQRKLFKNNWLCLYINQIRKIKCSTCSWWRFRFFHGEGASVFIACSLWVTRTCKRLHHTLSSHMICRLVRVSRLNSLTNMLSSSIEGLFCRARLKEFLFYSRPLSLKINFTV